MLILVYDGSFEGFLSVVFDSYAMHLSPSNICASNDCQMSLLDDVVEIATDAEKSKRVWVALQRKMDKDLDQVPYLAFLSGQHGIEMNLYRFMRIAFASPIPVTGDFADNDILTVRKAAKVATKEATRIVQFARFQQTLDGVYFAAISPECDVMPMVLRHFRNRFTDQQWVLYDVRRDYGFFYDTKTITEIVIPDKSFNVVDGSLPKDMMHEDEIFYQSSWKGFCQNVTIKERINLKVHKQFLPRRFWNYLIEKKI